MTKKVFTLLIILVAQTVLGQEKHETLSQHSQLAPLTVKKIMRNPRWMGTSPSDLFWSPDGKTLYFKWNPKKAASDSLYAITLKDHHPYKVKPETRYMAQAQRRGSWNRDRTQLTFKKGHSLYLLDVKSGTLKKLLQTTDQIVNPHFALKGKAIAYRKANNLYLHKLESGADLQLTNFVKGKKPSETTNDKQTSFLAHNALQNSRVLRRRQQQSKAEEKEKEQHKSDQLNPIYIGKASISDLSLNPDGRYVVYRLAKTPKIKHTIVPNYVTASGYTEDINGRPVVGIKQADYTSYIYDRHTQNQHKIDIDQIPGIRDIPAFIKNNYPDRYAQLKKADRLRDVKLFAPQWNKQGNKAVMVVRSQDHKDRWIMAFDVASGDLHLLDRQHDDAWVAGPGIGYSDQPGQLGWLDEHTIYYQSEKTGYSHLYSQNVNSGKETALTSGDYEIQDVVLSPDKKQFILTTNKIEPGQSQVYRLNIRSKKQTRLTPKEGGYEVTVSPDGRYLAERYSTSVHPWELYLQRNKSRTKPKQITDKAESKEYQSYSWQKPEIITFKDRDGEEVYAQVYTPKHQAASKPGVIFVHGAGYLQDVLKYWGYYFREHMFMNLLTDQGYTVMNIDYRGSAGYGRDWRTAIYRHMGKNDLADIVDGARYMTKNLDVNPDNIGLWGGSYGGFMTLMAMFKTDQFESGAALRSVTDWAHYNHGYTSDILNLPQNDSLAYQQSSPIYFADGLQGNLLMAHGMVDTNVHFQDIVRLTQKLIELGKEDWELAVYPVESHGFIEPSSWTDEYRRILKLFEETLK